MRFKRPKFIAWLRQFILFSIIAFSFSRASYAGSSPSGVTLSYPLITKDPTHLQGARLSFWHQPQSLIGTHARLILEGSLGYWWVNNDAKNNKINIFSLAPILRYYLINNNYISPFIDISIGLSFLSTTRLDDRNLGMHFTFQDQLGIGTSFGHEKRLSISISALHYSNASMCGYNAGITIPLLVNVGYRF